MSTTSAGDARTVLLTALIDDAALFPPARAEMRDAVADHLRHQDRPYAWMVGRFSCPVSSLPHLRMAVPEGRRIAVTAILDGVVGDDFAAGLDTDLQALALADDSGGVDLTCTEVRLPPSDPAEGMRVVADTFTRAGLAGRVSLLAEVAVAGRPPGEVAAAVGAVSAAQRRLTEEGRSRHAAMRSGPPRVQQSGGRLPSYAQAAATRSPEPVDVPPLRPADPGRLLGAKVRCSGETPDTVPSPEELAAFLLICRRAHVPWKATAGLHHPRRHPRDDGATEHGFLNVTAAAALAYEGQADESALVAALEDESVALDAEALTVGGRPLRGELLAAMRRDVLLSIGSCSIEEPVAELAALGVLTGEGALA